MKYVKKIVLVGFIFAVVVISIWNMKYNKMYWHVNIANCITILIALVFSYIFAVRNNAENKRKEVLQAMLQKLQDVITARECYKIDRQMTKEQLTMKKREISNLSRLVQELGKNYISSTRINTMNQYVDEYSNVIGDHLDDMQYLSKSENELKRPLDLLNKEIFMMMMELYK